MEEPKIENGEIPIDDLDNVGNYYNQEIAQEEALNNPSLYRQSQIDALRAEREVLTEEERERSSVSR